MTINEYRKANGLTLESLASLVNVTKGRLSQIENGATCSPDLALALEKVSDGQISATELSPTIAAAREGHTSDQAS